MLTFLSLAKVNYVFLSKLASTCPTSRLNTPLYWDSVRCHCLVIIKQLDMGRLWQPHLAAGAEPGSPCRMSEWMNWGVLPGEKQGTTTSMALFYKEPAQKNSRCCYPLCVSVSGMLIVQRRPVILWAKLPFFRKSGKSLPGKFSWVTQSSNFAKTSWSRSFREIN